MLSNLKNLRYLNVNERCSNLTQVAPANTGDTSHHMDCAQKQDADAECLRRVKMMLSSCMGSINFADPANIRKVHEDLMIQVRTKTIHTGIKYKIQIKSIQFE